MTQSNCRWARTILATILLIGATAPAEARPGTLRSMYGSNIQNNAVHGSDSPENAKKELAIAFGDF